MANIGGNESFKIVGRHNGGIPSAAFHASALCCRVEPLLWSEINYVELNEPR